MKNNLSHSRINQKSFLFEKENMKPIEWQFIAYSHVRKNCD